MKLEEILQSMQKKGASDLHLKSNAQPIIRKNGKLYLLDKTFPTLSNKDILDMIDPVMGGEFKKLFLKNKSSDFGHYFPDIGRFRFAVFLQKGTIRVVVRAIKDHVPSFKELNLPESLNNMVDYKNGLVLITGATGSGKSTTAASLINAINQKHSYHILTIEDPIEYVIHDYYSCVSQRELYLDFYDKTDAFRSALRQDPDVIFFGEIRDSEAMKIALQAADSGHLVLSTLHTSTALETIERCLSFFDGSKHKAMLNQLVSSLKAVVSQRLAPTLNNQIIPIVEILLNTTRLREALIDKKSRRELYEIMEEGRGTWGMQTFDQHIVERFQAGLISQETAIQFATFPKNVKLQCEGFNTSKSSINHVVDLTNTNVSLGKDTETNYGSQMDSNDSDKEEKVYALKKNTVLDEKKSS